MSIHPALTTIALIIRTVALPPKKDKSHVYMLPQVRCNITWQRVYYARELLASQHLPS
jgi:hypothetical protein